MAAKKLIGCGDLGVRQAEAFRTPAFPLTSFRLNIAIKFYLSRVRTTEIRPFCDGVSKPSALSLERAY
jgi:hypothetical protein